MSEHPAEANLYPTEDAVPRSPEDGGAATHDNIIINNNNNLNNNNNMEEEEEEDASQAARIAAAREKATAARAAAERRRSQSTENANASGELPSQLRGSGASTPIVVKRRPTLSQHRDSTATATEEEAAAAAKQNENKNKNNEDVEEEEEEAAQPFHPAAAPFAAAGVFADAAEEKHAENFEENFEENAENFEKNSEEEGDGDENEEAAALASIAAALAQVDEDERALEARLQLYSEVVALRKELAAVQADEARLREQRDNMESIVAAHDPGVNAALAVLEDEAPQSALQQLWREESAIHNPEKMDWATVDIHRLAERVDAGRRTVAAANERAEALFAQQAQRINAQTDRRERTMAGLRESYDEEMENLAEARQRLRQVAAEQRYHQHRGTNRGREPVVPHGKKQFNRERRIDQAELRTTQQVEQMNSQLTDLMEECKVMKKQLDESKRLSTERQTALETQLKTTEDEGAEAREMKEKLDRERNELAALKADLQGVLHYVRAKNREEEDF